ncbi:ribonuclease H-like domain-containing protein [Natranaeroarchaeum aerophilus]|uniref:Ribonuclease H-like domain-containing protein n=1 Tax=Natranaeroarchaeum aerophilus TaxID=2917711 RepID=A0AAE3FS65_9EURY|nr:ribonuclease H-like domain-containing protein [Natranaeroarchaeum aerophilus]MCL9814125.1 ribonuclease H-like domain-containing protein [Natranaeroarchaeum aerophilus]
MAYGTSLDLLSIPGASSYLSATAIEDALEYFDPEVICLTGEFDPSLYGGVRTVTDVPVIAPSAGMGDVTHHRRLDDGSVVEANTIDTPGATHDLLTVRDRRVLDDLPAEFSDGQDSAADTATVLVVPNLGVEYDPTTLSARLPGIDALAAIQEAATGPLTVLAGRQPANYHHVWESDYGAPRVTVHGMGAGTEKETELTLLSCTETGTAAGESVAADSFGLSAIQGIGSKTGETLRNRGITTRTDLVETSISALSELPGVGRESAETMHAHADVIDTGDPLRLTNESLPAARNGRSPICLDIETDGLSPTVVWQFGIYNPETDEYTAFVEDETPTEPGRNVRRFCDYLFGTHADRTLLTWNGDGFDYPVIERFLRQHAPEYVDAWDDLWKHDLYSWAVRESNALLPGRTNKLDDVARALGYEDAETGLTGAQTAAAYQRFMRTPDDPAAKPDWERHRRYCEDDCRALWHVWQAIEDARRRDPSDSATDTGGQQTGLTEF